jgi:hypothetical protein
MVDSIGTMFDTVGKHTSVIFCNFDTLRGITNLIEPVYCSIIDDINFTNEEGRHMTYQLNLQEEL